jgi:hypothetical protein
MKLEPQSQNEHRITQCQGATLAHKFSLLVSKKTDQVVHMW